MAKPTRAAMTAVQQHVLGELRAGATLRLRLSSHRRQMGDFILLRDGQQVDVVTRRTLVAICSLPAEE